MHSYSVLKFQMCVCSGWEGVAVSLQTTFFKCTSSNGNVSIGLDNDLAPNKLQAIFWLDGYLGNTWGIALLPLLRW